MLRALLRLQLNLAMAFATLVDRPSRSILTLLGIVIGIVALVVMMALVGALQSSLADAVLPLGVGVFQAQREPPFGTGRVDWSKIAARKPFELKDVRDLQGRLRLTKEVGAEAWSWGNAIKTAQKATNPVCGFVGGLEPIFEAQGMKVDKGRALDARDIEEGRPVAVIGSDLLKTLFPRGAAEAIGSQIRLKNRPFQVIGTLEEQPTIFGAAWRNCIAVIPLTTYEKYFGKRSLQVTFLAEDRGNTKLAKAEAYLALRTIRQLKPGDPDDFYVTDNEGAGAQLQGLGVAITVAAAAICLIALLVGGVGVMNIMLVSVMERTREIGVRKALGARRGTILFQFVTEAVVLTATGGAVGVGLAYIGVSVAAAQLEVPATVPGWAVVLALASSGVVGLLAGIYPAARAARLDPIEALRYE